jgi:hypothetical protein
VEKFLNLLKSELLTKLNLFATAALLWIVSQPGVPTDKVLGFLPESWHGAVSVILPLAWALLVQYAIAKLKKNAADQNGAAPVAAERNI